jgi:hypothetical protein
MKKKIAKQLEQIAGTMPLIMMNTCERHYVKGSELIEEMRPEIEGKKVDPETLYVDRLPVQMAINHKRRMKKMFKKFKGEGVQGYIDAVRDYQMKQIIQKSKA